MSLADPMKTTVFKIRFAIIQQRTGQKLRCFKLKLFNFRCDLKKLYQIRHKPPGPTRAQIILPSRRDPASRPPCRPRPVTVTVAVTVLPLRRKSWPNLAAAARRALAGTHAGESWNKNLTVPGLPATHE